MENTVRIGLIGCGYHGRRGLSNALTKVKEAELIACADVDEAATRKAVEDYGYAHPYKDYREMLSRESLDAVVVALPHHLLKDAAIASIQSGRHVFLEKPMGVNRREGEEIQDAVARSSVSLMVGYCVRFAESTRMMKELIDKGAIGEITVVSAGKIGGPVQLGVQEEIWGEWMTDPKRGGRHLLSHGVHITDHVLWMVGANPERVSAEVRWDSATGVDMSSVYTISFDNGVIASIIASQNVGRLWESHSQFIEVMGTEGRIKTDWPTNSVSVYSETMPEYRHTAVMRPKKLLNEEMYQDQMQAWVTSIVEKKQPPITADDGVKVLEVIDAVFESERTGRPVILA